MKMVICSIRDSATEAWFNPMFFQARAQAIRSFSDAVNGPMVEQGEVNNFAKHPEDFQLFALGEWDPSTGELSPFVQAEPLGLGSNFVRS